MPVNRAARLVEYLREVDEIWAIANIESISQGDSWTIALENSDEVGFGWVSERGSRSETTTPGAKERTIFAHEWYAEPRITQKALDDLAFDVDGWLARRVRAKFEAAGGAAFITGTGSGQPFGLVTRIGTGTDKIATVNSGHNTSIKADQIIELHDDMPRRYQGQWLMHRSTRRFIRQLKDGAGNYLWERSVQVGQPSTLLGSPMYEATSMDTCTGVTFTQNEYVAFYGNFSEAYTIVNRQGIRVLRDPYTAKPYVLMYTTGRIGGDVVNAAAVKALKVSA
jgi:HK97 family phage major capsid protein